jgi:type III restriction enzyme
MTEHANVLELDLPEIAGRDPYAPPTSHLEKTGADTWSEVPGRRVSRTLLVDQIRPAMDAWRSSGWPGVTHTTRRLLGYWFDEDHLLASGEPFRFYYCQREAVETLVYLFEVQGIEDCADLVQRYFKSPDLLELDILTSSKGQRLVRRYIPEIGKTAEQQLPPACLARYAVKMATGSGETMVMALLVAWSHLNRRLEPGSGHADNFLIVAPNVIVYERLREYFDSARIFHGLPIIPPEWKSRLGLQTVLRGDARDLGP